MTEEDEAGDLLFGQVSGLSRLVAATAGPTPLIIAIHGGSYTSRYFDVPGFSLLDKAAANGLPILAVDRPAYGRTPALDNAGLQAQADYLRAVLPKAWAKYGEGCCGVVLIGHSIGGAIAALIASDPGDLPLIGLAISGIGLRTPPGHNEMWKALPQTPQVEIPSAIKEQVMFGPANSFDAAIMPRASHVADAPAPKAELIDITSTWQDDLVGALGHIAVPVHYRQGERDGLWVVDADEIKAFARTLAASPRIDAAMMRGIGHCIDFHRVSSAFHLQQLGFALECAADVARSTDMVAA